MELFSESHTTRLYNNSLSSKNPLNSNDPLKHTLLPHTPRAVFLRHPSSHISVGRINALSGLFWLLSGGRGLRGEGLPYLPHMQRPDVFSKLCSSQTPAGELGLLALKYEAPSVFLPLSLSLSMECAHMYCSLVCSKFFNC